jgi:2-polyprenyl-6-methoxyphenol hydroxylase-like FAD-dependent oxidoreductase
VRRSSDCPVVLDDGRAVDLDPLGIDRLLRPIRQLNARGDVAGLVTLLRQLAPSRERVAVFSRPDSVAAIRDLGVLIGSVKRWGVEPVSAVPELGEPLVELGARTGMVPRDTVFHYTGWNPLGTRERTYTGHAMERSLISAVRTTLPPLVIAVELCRRLGELDPCEPEFADTITELAPSVESLVRAIDAAAAGVAAEFFATVDVLVGADGIGSAVRARLHPDEGPPVVARMMMWRGLSWAPPFLTGRSMAVLGTDVERIVTYPIDTSGDGARCLINWVAAGPVRSNKSPVRAERVDSAEVIERFGDWRVDWLDLHALFRAAEHIHCYPMVDRNPLPRWSVGGIALLGDAAHAMLPMGSNGATQSILDARALAAALATSSDVAQALVRYESERRPAMTRLQARNRDHSPEAVIAEAHRRAPEGFDDVRDVLSEHELMSVAHEYTTTAGLDVEYVNTCPPSIAPQADRMLR